MKTKNKEIIFQDTLKNEIFNKDLKIKLILKYFILFFTTVLSAYFLIDNIKSSNLKEYKKILWTFIIFGSFNFLSFFCFKINDNWIRSKYSMYFWTIVILIFEILLVFVINNKVPVKWLDFYNTLFYIIIPIISIISLFSLNIYFLEKKIQPLMFKKNSQFLLNNISWIITFLFLDFILKEHFLFGSNRKLDINNIYQMLYIILFFILLFGSFMHKVVIFFFYTNKLMSKKTNYNDIYLLSMMLITPFTIWFTKDYSFNNFDKFNWLFLIVPLVSISFPIVFLYFKNSELSSFKIFKIIISISLLLIWGNKFIFESYYDLYLDFNWTIIITIVSTNILCLLLIFKRSSDSLIEAVSFSWFIISCIFVLIGLWVVKKLNISTKILFEVMNVNELINTTLLLSITLILARSIWSWFYTMKLLNDLADEENKIIKRKFKKKEFKNE